MLYNFADDSFYIMKLCSRLFVLHCRSRPKYDTSMHFDLHFEEVRGGVEPWQMARWKALAEFLLSIIELLFTARRYASTVLAVVVCPSVCPSVCLSVTSRYCIETATHRITQTTPYGSPGNLVF